MSVSYIDTTLGISDATHIPIDVPYTELSGSPRAEKRADGLYGVREFVMGWEFAEYFTNAAMGVSVANGDGSQVTIYRPLLWSLGGANYCVSAKYKPFFDREDAITGPSDDPLGNGGADANGGPTMPLNTYARALVTLEFATMNDTEEEWTPGCEVITGQAVQATWKSDGTPVPAGALPGKLVMTGEWLFSRRWMPTVPTAYPDLIGSINSFAVTSPKYGITFPSYTLLYQGPQLSYTTDAAGDIRLFITNRFSFRQNGWNKIWRPQLQIWDSIAQYQQYEDEDFTLLDV